MRSRPCSAWEWLAASTNAAAYRPSGKWMLKQSPGLNLGGRTTVFGGFFVRADGVSGAGFRSLIRKVLRHASQSCHDARGSAVVDLVGRVGRLVVVRVAERGGVRDHERRPAFLPEGPVVGPADALDRAGEGGALRGELRVLAERREAARDQLARRRVANEGDEVALARVEQVERRGVALAALAVVVEADRFRREHC